MKDETQDAADYAEFDQINELPSIKNIAIICALSDGTVRVINTNRQLENQLLQIIKIQNGGLSVSPDVLLGITIENIP